MKNIFNKNKKLYLKSITLLSALALVLFGCVYLDSVSVKQLQEDGTEKPIAKAGTIATFTVKGNIDCKEDHGNVQFVVSFLAPKSWNVRKNAKVTYTTTLNTDADEVLFMSPIPESSLPVNGGGRTWANALMQEYGVGSNVLSDMEWVTFQTNAKWAIYNGDKPSYTIYIRTNVGELNLRAYLGFFVNHTDDGISTSPDHKKVKFSEEPFEVVEGKGLMIDFCQNHFNKVQPLAALQNDFVTFSFNGNIAKNDLILSKEIYVEATAYDASGKVIAVVNERSNKTLLTKESYSQAFSLTMWPTEFFNIPEGEIIDHIKYIFTNYDGSITITQTDDDKAIKGITPMPGEKVPFMFELMCI